MILLRSVSCQILFYGWLAALLILYLPLLLAPRRWMVKAARFWVRGALVILRVTAGLGHEVRGRENKPAGAFVVAAKHQSMWDTLIFHTLLDDPVYILKKELTAIPFFGWYLRQSGMIAVDRKAGAKAMRRMVEDARRAVAEGRQIVIFPEGTRTAPGSTPSYHPGVAMLYDLGVPLVPVALNSGLYWGRRSFRRRPGRIVIEFLPAIPPGLDRRAFLARLSANIEAATGRLVEEAKAGGAGAGCG